MDELQDYYDRCEKFDWFFEYSDDHRVWRAGTEARDKLVREAQVNPDKYTIFHDWQRHMFSGDTFGTPKQPKPKRPS